MIERIFVDFQKVDDDGRLIPVYGTWLGLQAQGIELEEGLCLPVYDPDELVIGIRDDIIADVKATYDLQNQRWTFSIIGVSLGHESDFRFSRAAAEAEAYGGTPEP